MGELMVRRRWRDEGFVGNHYKKCGFFRRHFPDGLRPLGNAVVASATVFSLQNHCSYTVWQGTLFGNGAGILGSGGFALQPGSSVHLTAPSGWSGRFWARTGCTFDDSGAGKCATEDCAGGLKCIGGGVPPVTLVEFKIGSSDNGNKDFYDYGMPAGVMRRGERRHHGGSHGSFGDPAGSTEGEEVL
ncbi:pathogenesis-related protein 5 [Vigna angularis]|uniref:pathogenesis-related protein 5 n=1 Tax=Phaseolus angularis TaxID=3914 RepID=UPI0022B34078|nr:pathogenesis-related protein 5 [Vigna angularis]